VFCACETIKLLSVVFSVVIVLHKFDLGPVTNETQATIGKKVI